MLQVGIYDQNNNAESLIAISTKIRENKNFDEAVRHYLTNILIWRQDSRFLNKLVGSYARSAIVQYVVYLSLEGDNLETGATYLRLLELCRVHDLCSSRVLTTVLTMLRLGGLVTVAHGVYDRRLKFFKPTPKLYSYISAWYSHVFATVDILYPALSAKGKFDASPDFIKDFILDISRPYFAEKILIGEFFPDLFELFRRDSGFPTAASILEAHMNGKRSPSVQMISKRFNASTSQTRTLLKVAEDNKLIKLGKDGQIVDHENLVDCMRQFISREIGFYILFSLNKDRLISVDDRSADAVM